MELTHIEHLGIAVKSIEACLPYYEEVLGLKCYNIEEVPAQKVRTAFLKIGQTKIELLESTDVRTGAKTPIEEEASNVLQWFAADGTVVSVRPSGTEPKIKFYFGVRAELESVADFDRVEAGLDAKIETIKKELKLV